MLRLRPYKLSDARTIISWCKDEATFRKWTSDRYGSFPITEADMNKKYVDNNGDCPEPDNFCPMTAFEILKVDKVTIGAFENNPPAYHCYKAAGFKDVAGEEVICELFGEKWKILELALAKEEYLSRREEKEARTK